MKWQQATLSWIESLTRTRLKVILNTGLLQNLSTPDLPLPLTDGYIVFFNPSPVRISRTLSASGGSVDFSWNFKQRGLNLIFKKKKSCLSPLTTLGIRRALEPKCIAHIVSGIITGDAPLQLLANFFPVPSNSLKSFCTSLLILGPVPFLFLKGQLGSRGWCKSAVCCS